MALAAIQDTVLRHDLPADLLRETVDRLAQSQQTLPELSDGLKGERWMARDFVRLFVESPRGALATAVGDEQPISPLDSDGRRLRTALSEIVLPDRTMALHMKQFYDRLEEIARLPTADATKASREGADERMLKDIPGWSVPARLLLPALPRARQRYVHCDAQTRLTRAVVHLKLFRVTHDDWPNTLNQVQPLTQHELLDPFTGGPLEYLRTADGWILYSVGPDLADNRGHRRKDVPARFPLPAPKPFMAE